MKVFIVEDDPIIIEGLTIALTQEGNEVESSSCMAEAMDKLQSGISFDICLLDVMLPDGDGYQICRTIRNRSDVPILFLTACDDEVHTVLALEQGADDYVSKPFRIRELTARMKAILRRTGRLSEEREKNSLTAGGGAERASEAVGEAASDGGNGRPGNSDVITLGGNDVNVMSGKVFRGEEEIFLSSVEYRLLLTFLKITWSVRGMHTNSEMLHTTDRVFQCASKSFDAYVKRIWSGNTLVPFVFVVVGTWGKHMG